MYTVDLLDQEMDLIIVALDLMTHERLAVQQMANKLLQKLQFAKRKQDHPDDRQDVTG